MKLKTLQRLTSTGCRVRAMYVTRPLSWYRKHPSALSKNPEEPFSGYLVITDEEAQAEDTFCFGMCGRRNVHKLPFPQDKLLTVYHLSGIDETMRTKVWFLPVIGQPLSSNRYYAIKAKGRYKGQVCKCSKEAEMGFCCFSNYINDKRPRPFDHRDIYQQVKIHRHYRHTFFAKSVAPDGIPPKFLKKKGWKVRSSKSYRSELNEALGLDVTARSLLPSLDFPIYNKHSHTVVVGKWCCPFVFVREEYRLREQMKKSLLYKMTLEQKWEEIFSCQNVNNESRVNVDVDVQREVNLAFGMEALKENMNGEGGFVWYRGRNRFNGRGVRLGLSSAIVEKMKWVEEVGGFVDGGERVVRVQRMEEIDGERVWRRFGCYVLVESFNLRRWDGTLIMKSQFRHTNHIQCKWE